MATPILNQRQVQRVPFFAPFQIHFRILSKTLPATLRLLHKRTPAGVKVKNSVVFDKINNIDKILLIDFIDKIISILSQ